MQSYSHYIVAAALVQPLKKRFPKATARVPEFKALPLLIGSIIPDVPLILIGIGAFINDVFIKGIDLRNMGPENPVTESTMSLLFRDWYFNNPWVISAYNLFHAPLMCLGFIALGYWAWKNKKSWGAWFFWFAIGALSHAAADIPLHVDDGALFFFPFYWGYRFESPISYWDSNYYGREWSIFEHSMDVVLVVYMVRNWLKRRKLAKNAIVDA